MEVLVLGGTGAMGTPLVKLLSEEENNIYVTSRSRNDSVGNVHYLMGNAKDDVFLLSILNIKSWDVIVDFMVYGSQQLEKRLPYLLKNTRQYVFFSSSRVYADSAEPITESSSRLLDVVTDEEYLKTDEYALAKAREENLLISSGYANWTIIRPYITYNTYRLQLGVYEKENWLKRSLEGRTIVFPHDIADKTTTLTYGPDVAAAIIKLLGNEKAYGQAFHVVSGQSVKWQQVMECYSDVISVKTGKCPKVKYVDTSDALQNVWNPWQIKYDRLYNRVFDNSKIEQVRGVYQYKDVFEGLTECLSAFLDNPKWLDMRWRYEAYCDRVSKELTPLNEIAGEKTKLKYLKWRFLG